MEELLLRHAGHVVLPRPAAPRRRRLRVAAVALRSRPTTSLAVPGLTAPPAPPPPATVTEPALEPVLPSPPVARVPEPDLPRVLRRRPRLLVTPVAARLRPTLYFLRALGVPDLHRRADLLSFPVEEKLLPRIEFLESLGLHPRAARSMARRFPALFCYAVEGNMRPKAEYLMRDMGRDPDELFDFPEYFSYALATRIAPRHEACAARGVRMPLPAMLRPGDTKFRATLASCVGSTPPRRRSPLWYAAWVDDDAGEPVK